MPKPKASETECRECGAPTQRGAAFCQGPACRTTWHNRRKARGAELYDLVMAMRHERDQASADAVFTLLANQARAYRDADKALRSGRHSWNLAEAIERIPLAYGKAGDNR